MKTFIRLFKAEAILTLVLLFASFASLTLVYIRFLLTDRLVFTFLIWNLFLAWLPYVIALLLSAVDKRAKDSALKSVLMIIIGFFWLLFYPNSPYIFTDFIHLINRSFGNPGQAELVDRNTMLWFDIILNIAFAFIGHIIGLISLYFVHIIAKKRLGSVIAYLILASACLLAGFGVYIGRFARLNSWDLFIDPIGTVIEIFTRAFSMRALVISFCFAAFIALSYLIIYSFKRLNLSDLD